jgi:hypothetical protein
LEDDDGSEQDDEQPFADAPSPFPDGGPPPGSSDDSPLQYYSDNGDGPSLFPGDDDDFVDGKAYASAAKNLAKEMHSAAVPEAPRIYVPPESLYVKRLALLQSILFCAVL